MKIFENGIKFFEKGTKDVIYLDTNNLYGYASGFKWIDPKGFDVNRYMK